MAGLPGAAVATIAIFLPAFVLVAMSGPLAARLRERRLTASVLDGLNAAAIGLMAAVSLRLGASVLVDPLTVIVGCGALAALLWARIPSASLVGMGAAIGLAASATGIGP